MATTPKVRHFFWRLVTGTLPVRGLLKQRHLVEDASCPWCHTEEESPWHAIFGCIRVKDLWEESGCIRLINEDSAQTMRELIIQWKNVDAKVRQRGAFLAWCIWNERNLKVFDEKTTPNDILLARVNRIVEEQGKYGKQIYSRPEVSNISSPRTWQPPPEGVIKINADASLADEGWVGMGIVARNHEGIVLFAATRRVRAWWPVEIAEAKALATAIKLGRRYGCTNVIVESDCKLLISRLSTGATHFSDLDSILDDILFLSSSFNSVVWSHIRRDGNFAAHHLAKLVPFGLEQVWENQYPQELSPYVLMDNLSLN